MNLPDLVGPLNKMFSSRAQPRASRSVHASSVGHICARMLFYDQLHIVPGNPDLQSIFALGDTLERQATIDLNTALAGTGIEIGLQQLPLPANEYGLGGRLDMSVSYIDIAPDGTQTRRQIPCEFKSCAPSTFDSVDTLEDLIQHRNVWVRKYPAQLQIYMHFTKADAGLFLLRNKVSGKYKQIPVAINREYVDELLARATLVTKSVAAFRAATTDEEKMKAHPPRIPFEPAICEGCAHYSRCIPDISTLPEADDRLWDIHLDALCRLADELKPQATEYEEVMEKIKAHGKALATGLKKGESRTSITENYFVTAAPYQTTSYKVPEEIKKPFVQHTPAVRLTIKKIGVNDQTV